MNFRRKFDSYLWKQAREGKCMSQFRFATASCGLSIGCEQMDSIALYSSLFILEVSYRMFEMARLLVRADGCS